jgi:hypothetical protein
VPRLDLNGVQFQQQLFTLENAEGQAALKTFRKLLQLEWDQVYRDSGLNREAIDFDGERLCSIRITQKCRALVRRVGDVVQFVSLHPDHDSAYDR